MTGNGASESTDPVSGPRPSHGDSSSAPRRPCVWAQSAQGLRGFLERFLPAARSGPAAHLWRGALGAAQQSAAQSSAGRTLQHGSSQRCRWPDNIAARLCRNIPRCPPAWAAIAGRPGAPHRYGGRPISYRSVLMPNNSVPIRKPRRLGPAKYLRRQLRLLRRRVPHLRKRLPTPRHLLMKPSLRTGRIANCCSSTPLLIGGLRRLTAFPSCVSVCHSGGNDHSCSSHYRDSLGSSRSNHRASYRKHF